MARVLDHGLVVVYKRVLVLSAHVAAGVGADIAGFIDKCAAVVEITTALVFFFLRQSSAGILECLEAFLHALDVVPELAMVTMLRHDYACNCG